MPKYFHFHSDNIDWNEELDSKRCEAIKSDGQQCKKHTVIGLDFCYVHTKSKLKLQIKKSTIKEAGKGLFAVGPPNKIIFKNKQRICLYNGEFIDADELYERYQDDTAPYGVRLNNEKGEPKYEDAATERGIGSTANHTSNKSKINARLAVSRQNRCQLMATKDIKGGKEILVDYGDEYNMTEPGVETYTDNKQY
jgi:hypothetical protein